MKSELKRLIEIAGSALEAEDKFLIKAVAANQVAYPHRKCGILRLDDRYLKFVVARALYSSSFPFATAIEMELKVKSHDLVIHYPNDDSRWFAAVEMRRWTGRIAYGWKEIRSIRRAINEKFRPSKAENALMLILTANGRGLANWNLGQLAKKLGISQPEDHSVWEIYCFPIVDEVGYGVADFCVAGYEVKSTNSHGQKRFKGKKGMPVLFGRKK
jgi:hypothetical protein